MDGFLEYVPGDSFLHRLNPVTKIAFAIMFAIACFCTGTYHGLKTSQTMSQNKSNHLKLFS